ncbi:MAG: DnaJ domain-containing protein [Alphaproteobacteria bacterium]|nr:DnaJ domain-containing protein [Alphaproteobacteria bacterium]
MENEDLQLAADFCKLVGAPNLLVYLGMDENGDPQEARSRLKSRRRFMQGMQGNPKYKKEALLLIKHFSNLNEVLADPATYLADARRRSESEHLPVIEMTVRGVLAAGGLTPDQEEYLHRNALELGVTEQTFRELLVRVATELGVPMRGGKDPTPAPPPPRDTPVDLYSLLGVSPSANEDDIRIAYQRRMEDIAKMVDQEEASQLRKRVDIAQKVLSNDSARRHYDLTAARTGPPARAREFRPDQAATAPPVRERQSAPTASPAGGGMPRLEVLGEPVRPLRVGVGMTVTSITIRNGGDGPMAGVVAVDVPWMAVDPKRLDPTATEQTISVQLDPSDLPESASNAVVTIQTDRGERARVVFELQRGASPAMLGAFLVALIVLLVVLLIVLYQLT